jgi:signal transduction histidine kinase
MLADSVDEFEKEEIEEIARALNNSSNNIFKLIENLLNWARIQLGSFDISLHNFTLFDPVINTLLVLNEAAKQKNITLINRIKKSIYVYADENSVEMIVRNLINNAIKFTNEGGKITISASQKKGFATVTVADTGIGMPKEILGKLFDISQKVSRSGTNNEPGTGLGLILVKELVEKNGGTISVKSSEGKGSKFIFTLPLAKEE